jgi:hypothetical protein
MSIEGEVDGVKVSEVAEVSGQVSDEREGAVLREALVPFGMPLVLWRDGKGSGASSPSDAMDERKPRRPIRS